MTSHQEFKKSSKSTFMLHLSIFWPAPTTSGWEKKTNNKNRRSLHLTQKKSTQKFGSKIATLQVCLPPQGNSNQDVIRNRMQFFSGIFQHGWSHWHNAWRNPLQLHLGGYPKVAKMDQIHSDSSFFNEAMSIAKRVSKEFVVWKKTCYVFISNIKELFFVEKIDTSNISFMVKLWL